MKTYREYQPRQGSCYRRVRLTGCRRTISRISFWTPSRCLDLSLITAHDEREGRGFPPHDPRMMTALLCIPTASVCRRRARSSSATQEDIAFRILAGNTHPDHPASFGAFIFRR